jgi:hypothetical protein
MKKVNKQHDGETLIKTLTEPELQDHLFEQLKNLAKSPNLIGAEVPIPYKHIYIPTDTKTKLEIWCFKQDITIYRKLFDNSVGRKESYTMQDGASLIDVILEKSSAQHVGLPLVILELKKEQPNTHDILTYSQKTEMIKTIFPYCRFLFLVQGKISARTYRFGINFDEIILLKDAFDVTEIENLRETIKKHLAIALENLGKLTETNYKKRNEL